jgi:hypothetical protein
MLGVLEGPRAEHLDGHFFVDALYERPNVRDNAIRIWPCSVGHELHVKDSGLPPVLGSHDSHHHGNSIWMSMFQRAKLRHLWHFIIGFVISSSYQSATHGGSHGRSTYLGSYVPPKNHKYLEVL